MTHIFVFNACLVCTILYAWCRGGLPERAVALTFLVAATATYLVPYKHYQSVEGFVLAIDALTFVALTLIALRANRFWPLYECALQLLMIAIHGVKAYQPDFAYWMYNGASGKLAYPTLILLVVGVFRHRRRITAYGVDRDWSAVQQQLQAR